jgi:hypothetical protein
MGMLRRTAVADCSLVNLQPRNHQTDSGHTRHGLGRSSGVDTPDTVSVVRIRHGAGHAVKAIVFGDTLTAWTEIRYASQ